MFAGTGIGNRLNGIVLSINLAVLLIIMVIAVSSSNAALRAQTLSRFAAKNSVAAAGMNATLGAVDSAARRFVAGLSVTTFTSDSLRQYTRQFMEAQANPLFHRISIFNDDDAAPSVGVFQQLETQDRLRHTWRWYTQPRYLPRDEHLLAVLSDQRPQWFLQLRLLYDPEARAGVSLALPFVLTEEATGETRRGVVWLDMTRVALQDALTRVLNEQGLIADTTAGYSVVVDSRYTPISLNNLRLDRDTVNIRLWALRDRLAETAPGTNNLYAIAEPVREVNAVASRQVLPLTDWRLLSVLPLEEIPTLPVQIFVPIGLVALVGLLTLAWTIHRFIVQAVVRPLLRLGEAAQEIGSGDLRYYIGYTEQEDEIGRLARALEGMKSSIAHSYDELSRWSRTLEQRVIQRTRELDEARKQSDARAGQLQAVYDESLLVVNEAQLRPVLNAFTARILTLLKATYCAIWLLTEDRERLQMVAATEMEPLLLKGTTPVIDSHAGITGEAVQKAAPVVINDYSDYPQRILLDNRSAPFVRAVAVPLMFVGRPIGAVVVGRGAEDPVFNDADVRLLTLFANLVSPSVRNAQLYVRASDAVQSAERANQVKTRFLASVTHELRTPLNLIINNVDFMRIGAFGDVTPEQVSRLNQTTRSAEHLLYLINDLLDVSKIEAGEMELFIQTTDIRPLLEDIMDNAQAFLEKLDEPQQQLTLRSEIEDDLPMLPVDARRLRQVLTNLMTNAIKFTPQGEVCLSVQRDPLGVRFSVRDTGMGIAENELPGLFAAFERTRMAKENNIEGTGLGLAISQHLVQRHGGTLQVSSTPGQGSTFWFTLADDPTQEVRRTDRHLLTLLNTRPE
ncbi:MAG: ATP-binding protein [Anaerolineae bacterium]|nr:ATP-binding protein [Anaerolineae bacterium]